MVFQGKEFNEDVRCSYDLEDWRQNIGYRVDEQVSLTIWTRILKNSKQDIQMVWSGCLKTDSIERFSTGGDLGNVLLLFGFAVFALPLIFVVIDD